MHAVPVAFNFHLPGCTEGLCHATCLEHANKYNNQVVKISHCEKPDICHCEFSSKQYPLLTTEAMGLADAEDHNGTFV
jgi:hypothetical protein